MKYKIILNILDDLYVSAIIVSGGDGIMDDKSVEVLHSDGTPWCSLPDLPEERSYHAQTGLLACGGVSNEKIWTTSCFKFSEGKWKPSHKLKKERDSHSSWASPAGTVLMGGVDVESSQNIIGKTTELLDDTSSVPISIMHFPLKYEIS